MAYNEPSPLFVFSHLMYNSRLVELAQHNVLVLVMDGSIGAERLLFSCFAWTFHCTQQCGGIWKLWRPRFQWQWWRIFHFFLFVLGAKNTIAMTFLTVRQKMATVWRQTVMGSMSRRNRTAGTGGVRMPCMTLPPTSAGTFVTNTSSRNLMFSATLYTERSPSFLFCYFTKHALSRNRNIQPLPK